jgi:hypothetical protein
MGKDLLFVLEKLICLRIGVEGVVILSKLGRTCDEFRGLKGATSWLVYIYPPCHD